MKMSRRDFLLTGGQLGLLAALGGLIEGPALAQDDALTVAVPPSLMLHSKDNFVGFMDTLIKKMGDAHYTPTTYKAWEAAILAGTPIEKPVFVSIDDISMTPGALSFDSFRKMHDLYYEAGMLATFAVITRPDLPQSDELWDEVAEWVRQGFELATHTSYHSNFNARDTSPRTDFTEADYDAEIVASAQLIEEKMAERDIDYQVRTLVTPYGSGYSRSLKGQHEINPGIVAACAKTHIKFVVGITLGREPVEIARLQPDDTDVIYLGRMPPLFAKNAAGRDVPQSGLTFKNIEAWPAVADFS